MLSLHDTLTHAVRAIEPIEAGSISMYSCGPTVYRPVHVGNLRSFLLADLVRRALRYHGLDVRSVMNITDVGHMTDELTDEGRDRMLLAADDEGLSTSDIAAKYTQAFFDDSDALRIERFDLYPRASDHITQIVDLVATLIDRGHAYEKDGSVYYDVTSFPGYGKLSHQSLDDMRAGHRIEVDDARKRHHQDFVLWVAAGPRRELVFESPWGTGYPGWHIECSAMSIHTLGPRIDIHTGGVDNRFPHHEDEIAQSEGAVGHPVVNTWVHGEHLLMGRAKMAKSAGNVITISDVVAQGHDALAFRYLCFTARYRRQVHFTDEALTAAGTGLRRLREQVASIGVAGGASSEVATTDEVLRSAVADAGAIVHHDRFVASIDDDLDLPAALAVLHEAVADAAVPPAVRWALVASWDRVLGLELAPRSELPERLVALVAERDQARANKNFAHADEIREQLRAEGVDLLDSAMGTSWVRRS